MNNQYLTTSPYATRNGSHVSLLADDAPVAQPWETGQFFQPTLQNPYEDSMYYENFGQDSKQSLEFLADWVPEEQANHTYTHAANPNTSYPANQSPETPVQQGSTNFCKTNVQKNFVRKLYDMLGDVAANAYIYWNQDGKSFVIENPEQFAKKVLKRYLKTENFQSFIRQLNMYDFHKINRAQRAQRGVQAQTTQYVFSHTKFRRGEPELLSEIRRKGTEQPLDAPPEYNSLVGACKFGPGIVPTTQPIATAQPDYQAIVFQAEMQNLKQQLAQLQAAYYKLDSEHNALKASLQASTATATPQVQGTLSSSATTYQASYGGDASNPVHDLNRSGEFLESSFSSSAPQATKLPELLPHFTGISLRNNTNQAASTSQGSLESTAPQTRRRLSNPPVPDMGTNPLPTPQQPRGPAKARPGSWYENVGQWLTHFTNGSQYEAGPSNSAPQDLHATHNTNHGKGLGGRAQPVVSMAHMRRSS